MTTATTVRRVDRDAGRPRWRRPVAVRRLRSPAGSSLIMLLLGLLVLGGHHPAAGHAGSELPTAVWDPADGREVTGTWTAPPDDAAWIGETLGLLPDGSMEAYLGGSADAYPSEDDLAALTSSPELADYLLEHVRVRQDGVDCDGEVEVADDFVADGARFRFTCPQEVATAEIRITILHDQDETFRTFSGDGTLQDALHTAEQPSHTWDFTAAEGVAADEPVGDASAVDGAVDGSSPTWPLLVGGLAVIVGGLVALAVLGRPTSRGVRRRRSGR